MRSMVDFGALTAFGLLHLTVMRFYLSRKSSMRWSIHLPLPFVGFIIITDVMIYAGSEAHIAGLIRPVVGI